MPSRRPAHRSSLLQASASSPSSAENTTSSRATSTRKRHACFAVPTPSPRRDQPPATSAGKMSSPQPTAGWPRRRTPGFPGQQPRWPLAFARPARRASGTSVCPGLRRPRAGRDATGRRRATPGTPSSASPRRLRPPRPSSARPPGCSDLLLLSPVSLEARLGPFTSSERRHRPLVVPAPAPRRLGGDPETRRHLVLGLPPRSRQLHRREPPAHHVAAPAPVASPTALRPAGLVLDQVHAVGHPTDPAGRNGNGRPPRTGTSQHS